MNPLPQVLSRAAARAVVAATAATVLSITLMPDSVDGDGGREDGSRTITDRIALAGGNPVTPGNFRGYAFDQCETPSQYAMNRWLNYSRFLGVGVYIAGDQRYCREQKNLTPQWVRTQLRRGWKLLPIVLGPQASCQPRFPRWGGESIDPRPGSNNRYSRARKQGRQEAHNAVRKAKALGIVPGSTLYYDLEGFDDTNRRCRESAMWFLNAWTWKIHGLGYKSGVYSSAGSGIQMLERERVRGHRTLPDQIWIARWDGKANTSTHYISEKGWRPGGRLKQYRGGHNETHGGVTINVDNNWVDLGRGLWSPRETHCGRTSVNRQRYMHVKPPASGARQRPGQIKPLQCFLKEAGYYDGRLNGRYTARTRRAASAWKVDHGFAGNQTFWRWNWMALLSDGNRHALKLGSTGRDVRRAQRALNAFDHSLRLRIDGRYTKRVARAVADYRDKVGLHRGGVLHWNTWRQLQRGRFRDR